ncbi:MAG: 30S ribosome-binding factor RbfA [Pseudomonadota bacterium]
MRTKKVASAIKRELASAILFESSNPLFKKVVITRVEVTKDLRTATVYFTNYLSKSGDRKNLEKQVNRAAPYFNRLLRPRFSFKYFPELRFRYDTSIEKHERLEEVLKEIKE